MQEVKKPEAKPKRLIILRGVPGSGKSRYANWIFKPQYARIISSDDLFYSMKANRCFYRSSLENESHQYCRSTFVTSCEAQERLVVIDDFNILKADVDYYVAIGQYYGYSVEMIRFPWPEPPINWRNWSVSMCKGMQRELDSQPLEDNEKSLYL
jgi:predicted kinase